MADHHADAPIEWDDALSTGVSLLDDQHKALFECLDMLEGAAAEKSMLRTFHVMERLSGYARDHFAEEELLMRMHGYPELPDHIREHRSFTNRLFQLRKTYLDRDISPDLIALLRDWLVQHVAKTDILYVPYVSAGRRLGLPAMPAAPVVNRMDADILSVPVCFLRDCSCPSAP